MSAADFPDRGAVDQRQEVTWWARLKRLRITYHYHDVRLWWFTRWNLRRAGLWTRIAQDPALLVKYQPLWPELVKAARSIWRRFRWT